MAHLIKAVCLLSFIILITACAKSDDKINIKSYYFPIEELTEGKVYEYQSANDPSLPPEYWYYRSFESDTGTFFIGNFYDENFEVQQFFTEEIVSNGTLMQNYFLYARDTAGLQVQVPTEILVPNVFPFEVRDSGGIFLYKMKWNSGQGNEGSTTLIRNRYYEGKDQYDFEGKNHECVVFSLRELVEVYDPIEGNIEPEYQGKELYAKGIGLVYYEKELDEKNKLAYKLRAIYTMDELTKKAGLKDED